MPLFPKGTIKRSCVWLGSCDWLGSCGDASGRSAAALLQACAFGGLAWVPEGILLRMCWDTAWFFLVNEDTVRSFLNGL